GHREINVAAVDVFVDSLGDEHDADQDEETEGKNLERGVALHKVADDPGEHQHDADGRDHGGDHYTQVLRHADRRDHRVERKDDIEDGDLHQRPAKATGLRQTRLVRRPLQLVVNFLRAFGDQKKSAADQNEIAPGDFVRLGCKPRFGDTQAGKFEE